MKKLTKEAIEVSLKYARQKHPEFTDCLGKALLLAQEELGEAIQAFNNCDTEGVVRETAHTAAVLVRILNGEFMNENKQNDIGTKKGSKTIRRHRSSDGKR